MDGITRAESVQQNPGKGSNINWILGHIAVSRDSVLQQLGQTRIFPKNFIEIYEQGSKPFSQEGVIELGRLLIFLGESNDRICSYFDDAESGEPTQVKLKTILFFSEHEMYHVGQLGFYVVC